MRRYHPHIDGARLRRALQRRLEGRPCSCPPFPPGQVVGLQLGGGPDEPVDASMDRQIGLADLADLQVAGMHMDQPLSRLRMSNSV